jgi:enoyl-CoA hydratase
MTSDSVHRSEEKPLVLYEEAERVATLTLNRPARHNAIIPELITQLLTLFEQALHNENIRAIRLKGAGRSFCAGYDIEMGAEAMQALNARYSWDPIQDYQLMSGYVNAYMRLWHSSKPVIVQIQGYCVGGGSDLALCSDLIICAEDCLIGYPPARVWGSPTTAMWIYRLGLERTKRLLLTGDSIDGRTAENWGLASAAVPADKLDDAAFALARRVALLPSNQLYMMKLLINQAYEQMGLQVTQLIGTLLDGAARHTPEGLEFMRKALENRNQAIADRDGPFGDYGQKRQK